MVSPPSLYCPSVIHTITPVPVYAGPRMSNVKGSGSKALLYWGRTAGAAQQEALRSPLALRSVSALRKGSRCDPSTLCLLDLQALSHLPDGSPCDMQDLCALPQTHVHKEQHFSILGWKPALLQLASGPAQLTSEVLDGSRSVWAESKGNAAAPTGTQRLLALRWSLSMRSRLVARHPPS
ncbi:hypothetical protein CB1_000245025 [Camelus ferus]|nr:hypothetical protein CB1_000245025 [Camelus ferus]